MNIDRVNAGRWASELLERTSSQAERADTKASILLAGILAVAGGVSAVLSGAKWNPAAQPTLIQVAWWVAVVAAVVALACLGSAVYPRMQHRKITGERPVVGYFGDVVMLPSVEVLSTRLQASPDDAIDIAIDQLWQLSHIGSTKYWLIRWAIYAFVLSLVLLLVVLVAVSVS